MAYELYPNLITRHDIAINTKLGSRLLSYQYIKPHHTQPSGSKSVHIHNPKFSYKVNKQSAHKYPKQWTCAPTLAHA